jgi:3-oxoacyl-[acyl-carrier-protein] synthase-3
MAKITAAITAIGGYVPEFKLTNQLLEQMVDTTDDWILSRTGIKERRILKKEGAGTSYLGIEAVRDMVNNYGIDVSDVDFLICTTATPDMPVASTAAYIASEIGAVNAFSYDLMAACSGFLYGMSTAAKFIESGAYKKVLVVGADKMSSIIDYTDRATCVIFGDGAGCALFEPNDEGYGVHDEILRSDGQGRQFLRIDAGGAIMPASHDTVDQRLHYVHQEGQQVFKFAVSNMADVSAAILEQNNLTGDDVAWLVPHQANLRIIDATARRMGLTKEKVMINIEKYGNTTNGTLPLLLWDYKDRLNKGDKMVFAAFGGGFTWGAILLTWALDPKK